jgi:hypothetical protein
MIVDGLEKEPAALGWVGIPVRRGAKALHKRNTRKRERAIEEFREAAELPLRVAEVDLVPRATGAPPHQPRRRSPPTRARTAAVAAE